MMTASNDSAPYEQASQHQQCAVRRTLPDALAAVGFIISGEVDVTTPG
jgi:hypothetical protein